MFQLLALIRFGRFDEVLGDRDPPGGRHSGGRVGIRPRLREAARRRDPGRTRAPRESQEARRVFLRDHELRCPSPAGRLLGVLVEILEGEIARTAGDTAAAIAAFERAVALDDELDVDEPEPLPFPARHWLGAACSTRRDLRTPNASTWPICGNTLTTGGRCSDCSSR